MGWQLHARPVYVQTGAMKQDVSVPPGLSRRLVQVGAGKGNGLRLWLAHAPALGRRGTRKRRKGLYALALLA